MLIAAMVVSSVPTQMVTAAEVSSESATEAEADSASKEAGAEGDSADVAAVASEDAEDEINTSNEQQDTADDDNGTVIEMDEAEIEELSSGGGSPNEMMTYQVLIWLMNSGR